MKDAKMLSVYVEILIKQSAEARTALDALQLSQAACNAANAISVLLHCVEIDNRIK